MSTPVPTLFEKTSSLFRAAESHLRANAPDQAESLFRWTLGQIVLGGSPEGAKDWLAAQLSTFELSGNRKADARRWAHLLATAAALGHGVAQQAEAGCRWLGATGDADYALAQYGLALCGAGACTDRSSEWYAKLLTIPHEPDVAHFAYELLFVFRALEDKGRVRETTLIDVAARTFADSLWFTQPYSAAAHVCVLAQAGANDRNWFEALFDRLSTMEARTLSCSGRATWNLGTLAFASAIGLRALKQIGCSVSEPHDVRRGAREGAAREAEVQQRSEQAQALRDRIPLESTSQPSNGPRPKESLPTGGSRRLRAHTQLN